MQRNSCNSKPGNITVDSDTMYRTVRIESTIRHYPGASEKLNALESAFTNYIGAICSRLSNNSVCPNGTNSDGETCIDIDECTFGADDCNEKAVCINSFGSFECQCSAGYVGDGIECVDVDECTFAETDSRYTSDNAISYRQRQNCGVSILHCCLYQKHYVVRNALRSAVLPITF